MNIIKLKNTIAKALCFTTVFSFTMLNTTFINKEANTNNTVLAAEEAQVVFNGSVYDEKAEYYQYCLNKLGYKDYDNIALDTDGYFGGKSQSALNKFLKDNGFSYCTSTALDKLMALAESTANKPFNSGFVLDKNKLMPTAFIYSSLSNINNSKDPFYSMQVLKEFPFIITMRPDEMSYKSKRVAEYIKAKTKLFGYVNLGPDNPTAIRSEWRQADLNKVKTEIDSIAAAGWYGVFIDQFGYDWNETRERQNIIVDYIHSKGMKVMANSWFVDDSLGNKVDKIANPKGLPTHLNSNDWYLVESFFSDGDSYRADASYIEKYLKVKQYRDKMKINVAALSYKRDSVSWQGASEDIKNSYILAQVLGFNGWWYGKTDNADNLLYGKDPNINLGRIISPLKLKTNNLYAAETERYKIEYYAGSVPSLKLIPKK